MLITLCYHDISPFSRKKDLWDLSVSQSTFEKQLSVISDRHKLLNLSEVDLSEALNSDKTYILVTFDDIYSSVLCNALSTLEQASASCILFISPAFIDKSFFWWDGLEALANDAESMSVNYSIQGAWESLRCLPFDAQYASISHAQEWGSYNVDLDRIEKRPLTSKEMLNIIKYPNAILGVHTLTHPWLPLLDKEEIRGEIKNNAEYLDRIQPGNHPFFAYPYGAWDKRTRHIIKEIGFSMAFTTQSPVFENGELKQKDLLAYPRLCMQEWSDEILIRKIQFED